MSWTLGIVTVFLLLSAAWAYRQERVREGINRLLFLADNDELNASSTIQEEIDWAKSSSALKVISDRLGQAGFYTVAERMKARVIMYGVFTLCVAVGLVFGSKNGSFAGLVVGGFVGLYIGTMVWLYYLRASISDYKRELMFQLPLALESLILLAESGLGILPAIERVVSAERESQKPNPVIRIWRLVYELTAHGMPFGQSLEMVSEAADLKVLRHVLLHLDISGSEGGELVPSLRNLSEHSHTEWRLTVERRVKRLENLVVFPVFTAVIGLMLLTAAVPMVPVMKFRENLRGGPSQSSQAIQGVQNSQLGNH